LQQLNLNNIKRILVKIFVTQKGTNYE